jgi:3-hydroxyisobutyrate dehydrogenase-like beta-hydroxyacid dehydrogenase
MKLAINYNVISTIELISQSYIFAEKCGLPLEHLRDFYQQLWFAHSAPKMYAEKLLKRDFAGRGGFVMTGGRRKPGPSSSLVRSQSATSQTLLIRACANRTGARSTSSPVRKLDSPERRSAKNFSLQSPGE